MASLRMSCISFRTSTALVATILLLPNGGHIGVTMWMVSLVGSLLGLKEQEKVGSMQVILALTRPLSAVLQAMAKVT